MTWTTALSNFMSFMLGVSTRETNKKKKKLRAMLYRATQDGQMWSIGEGNGKPLQ